MANIWAVIDSYGIDPAPLFRAEGIDASDATDSRARAGHYRDVLLLGHLTDESVVQR